MAVDTLLYNRSTSADIGNTSVIAKLDTEDRPHVSAVLYHADANADYLVEASDTDSSADADWHALADNDATQSFRFEGTVPERWVRLRVDSAAGGGNTSDVSIQAVKGA